MREIKFRAWIPKYKQMRWVTRLTFGLVQTGNPLLIVYMDDGTDDPASRSIEEVELMQYTGLKDKNDKEIYEGDIIHFDQSRTQHHKGTVIWDESGFVVDVFYSKQDKWALGEENEYKTSHVYSFPAVSRRIEVIGNIHEKSKLLEKK